jgi:TonB-dependent SusC/RagA subfamily outer membrane receptor
MPSFFQQRAASLPLLAAFIVGCASSGGKPATTSPAPQGSTVTSQDIHPAPNEPIEKVLQGRISGVTVTQAADGGIAVQIRGQSAGIGGSQPLYVLDGVAITPGPGGSLTGISPYDIESIKVLKDPTDLTMYGSRGANGVIVIKTKKAKRPQ